MADTDDIGSDDEVKQTAPAETATKHALLQNLFGDESDESEEDAPEPPQQTQTTSSMAAKTKEPAAVKAKPSAPQPSATSDEPKEDTQLDIDVDDEEPEIQNQPEEEENVLGEATTVTLEKMPYPEPPPDAQLFWVKQTGFEIEPKPFEQDIFQPPEEEEKNEDDDGAERPKRIKLRKVVPTIRWKWGLNDRDEAVRQSNTRLVQWSDGSYTMFIGNDAFSVNVSEFPDHLNHQIFLRQRKDPNSESYLHCHGKIDERMSIQPTTIAFSQQKAQELTKAIMENNKNRQLMVGRGLGGDPEREKSAKQKLEEGRNALKQQFSQGRQDSLSADFLENDDRREKQGEAKILAAKRGRPVEEDEEEEGELEESMEDVEEDLEDLLGGDDDGTEKRKAKKPRR